MDYRQWSLMILALLGLTIGTAYPDEPPTVPIHNIQQYNGVWEGDRVRVVGVTTYETNSGNTLTTISDPGGGEWSAIVVYDYNARLLAQRNDLVHAVGIVTEYFDETEIYCSDEIEFPPGVSGQGDPILPINVTTASAGQERYENCLIRVSNAQVNEGPDEYGNASVSDGSGNYIWSVPLALDPQPQVGDLYAFLTGLNRFHFGEFKLRTRDNNDVIPATATPTPSTPTRTPTNTPFTSATPTPAPTNTPQEGCESLGARIWMPSDMYYYGDICALLIDVCNSGSDVLSDYPLFVILDVYGNYYFAPSFSEFDYYQLSFEPGLKRVTVLPFFSWPNCTGSARNIRWYAALTNHAISEIVGDFDMYEFGWEAECLPTSTPTPTPTSATSGTPTATPTGTQTPETVFHCDFDESVFDYGNIKIDECSEPSILGSIWVEGMENITVSIEKLEWTSSYYHPDDFPFCMTSSEEMYLNSSMGQIPFCVRFCPENMPHNSSLKLRFSSSSGQVYEAFLQGVGVP